MAATARRHVIIGWALAAFGLLGLIALATGVLW